MKSPIWSSAYSTAVSLLAATTIALFASGCGSQSFEAVQSQQNSDAPGSMSIAPKVDILLAVDDTGSTYDIQNSLNSALTGFLSNLQSQDWDFRIAAVPLTASGASVTKIAASHYDANWGADWVAPYPGAPKTSTIPSSMFVRPNNFVVSLAPNNLNNGVENGLAQIGSVVNQTATKNYFTRPEAILAIVVISNGQDTSDGTYQITPGQLVPNPTVSQGLINTILGAKSSALSSSVRLFSVVNTAGSRVASCLGGAAQAGSRYVQAANDLFGQSYDLCHNQLSTVLSSLKTDLQSIQLNYTKRYVLLSGQPNESTITVTKHAANGSAIPVPKSVNGSDGWKYLGYVNVPMVSDPVEMDFRTGYAVQLIGDAYKLTGSEYVTIDFTPYGVTSSQ